MNRITFSLIISILLFNAGLVQAGGIVGMYGAKEDPKECVEKYVSRKLVSDVQTAEDFCKTLEYSTLKCAEELAEQGYESFKQAIDERHCSGDWKFSRTGKAKDIFNQAKLKGKQLSFSGAYDLALDPTFKGFED